jgi:hypothetical protein
VVVSTVPVNNRWPVAEVLDAAKYYADKKGRRVSIEYALIRDVNDQRWRADMLGKKLHKALGSLVHVNLIPLNPHPRQRMGRQPEAGPGRVRPPCDRPRCAMRGEFRSGDFGEPHFDASVRVQPHRQWPA